MAEALVVCSHLPGEGHFESQTVPTISLTCRDDLDYWRGLDRLWPCGRTLILVEHDMAVTDEHVARLLACPYHLCTIAYRVHWRSTGQPSSIFAHSLHGRSIAAGEQWADFSGIGLCKIARDARIGELGREPWPRVELAVADAVRGPTHVHWPEVAHHHH